VRLLRAAAELIAEQGYERTTLAAIGKRAGYSHGLVTRRFGSKDGLIEALLRRMIDDWKQRELVPELEGRSGVDVLQTVIHQIRTSVQRDPDALRALYALMFEGLKPVPEVLARRMRDLHLYQRTSWADALRQGIAEGRVRPDIDPETTAALLVSTLRGAAYLWLLDPGFDIDAVLEAFEAQLDDLRTDSSRAEAGPAANHALPGE
jgi:AcrR family transcriptional regulator